MLDVNGNAFPRVRVVAYAFRHSYAQRHADNGTPVEVLRERRTSSSGAARSEPGDAQTAEVGRRILDNERQTAEKIARTWDHTTDLALREAGVGA